MRGTSVLVVEDEGNVRYVTAGALRLAGFQVTESESGHDALRRLSDRSRTCDLVVLDVLLPDLDGFEVCRRLRGLGVDTPVVFLTARDAPDDRLRGLSIGGDDYLVKPFSVDELVARVRAILRRAGKALGAPPLTVDHMKLELDDDARVVSLAGRELSLSPTEYNLLRYLMINRGRAMSRSQILDHVWDYDFRGESTVVESFISALRRKLDPDSLLIHTVRGFGYRLG